MASRADITLLLRRGGFPPRPAEVEAALLLGPERVVDQMLAGGADPGAAATPAPALDDPAELLRALRDKSDTELRQATAKRLRVQSVEPSPRSAASSIARLLNRLRPDMP